MSKLIFVLLLGLGPSVGHADCDPDLRVVRTNIVRSGLVTTEYKMSVDPKKHVALRVTSRTLPLGALGELGLRRISRAARGLNLRGPLRDHLKREVRLNDLHFAVPSAEEKRHRHPTLGKPMLEQFGADFADRAALLDYVVRHHDDALNVYSYSFTNEILAWRNLGEVMDLGPTRFATKTWLATTLRSFGVKGAIMVAGELPEPAHLADLPMRPTAGPTVLFFQPAPR